MGKCHEESQSGSKSGFFVGNTLAVLSSAFVLYLAPAKSSVY